MITNTLKFFEKHWKTIVMVALLVVCILSIRSCGKAEAGKITSDQILKLYNAQVHDFTSKPNKYGQIVNTQKAIIAENNKKLEKELLANSNLKKLNAQIKIDSEVKIRNVIAQYSGSNVYRVDTVRLTDSTYALRVDSSCIKTGTKFDKVSKWYDIGGHISTTGIVLDSISVKDSLTINVGLNTRRPFGRHDVFVESIHGNPFFKDTGMQSIVFKDNSPWYTKRLTIFVGGVSIGLVGAGALYYLFH